MKKDELYLSSISKDQTFLKNSKLRVYSCNAYNCLDFLQSDSPDQKILSEAIAAFNGCVKLLNALSDAAPNAQNAKDDPNSASKFFRQGQTQMLVSCFEHLAFLYLVSREPLKTLNAVAHG